MDRFKDSKGINPTTESSELDKKKWKCEVDEEAKKWIQAYMLWYWLGIVILFVVIFGIVVVFNSRIHF